ncbi:hypothetical protein NQ317_018408 [Molorchus minor]|uniref:Uncharacterized protein n=1 Tax=Molorchus minor TaxID=1323400 RepID=A0ABQ9JTD6_9CUCU|nr:hypothetical protein NQ317_018408 [Molorchus minor]
MEVLTLKIKIITLFVDLPKNRWKTILFSQKTQIKVYEDWPHHLLLKTCYRTSANLSDGSV